MHWIKKEYKKKARALERETRKLQSQLRVIEQEGFFSDREIDEKELRMEELKNLLAKAERELNLLWHLDKGGALRSLQLEDRVSVGAEKIDQPVSVAQGGKA